MIHMTFADLIEKYRLRRKMTRRGLALRIDISATYIGQIINRHVVPPPLEMCQKIASALGLSEEEKKEFYEAAYHERDATKQTDFKAALGSITATLHPPKIVIENNVQPLDVPLNKVPVISWVKANAFDDIHDPFPPGISDEWVYTTERGRNMFGLKVSNDCMSPEFQEGDIIIIRPDIKPENGKFVVVKDTKENQATFKQYKKYGDNIILHPLNPKYQDIVLDHDDRYQIIGVVVEKVKKY